LSGTRLDEGKNAKYDLSQVVQLLGIQTKQCNSLHVLLWPLLSLSWLKGYYICYSYFFIFIYCH